MINQKCGTSIWVLFCGRWGHPHSTTDIPPSTLVWGRLPRGPLAVLKDTMTGKMELSLNLGKTAGFKTKSRDGTELCHRTCWKSSRLWHDIIWGPQKSLFKLGNWYWFWPQILLTVSFSRDGPVRPSSRIKCRPAHSHLVDMNGAVKHLHADKLRKYHVNVEEISCDTISAGQVNTKCGNDWRLAHCAIIHEEDQDFGDIGIWIPQIQIKLSYCQVKRLTFWGWKGQTAGSTW